MAGWTNRGKKLILDDFFRNQTAFTFYCAAPGVLMNVHYSSTYRSYR